MAAEQHSAHLLIGSNIEPVKNTRQALLELCHFGILKRLSRTWQTPAYGSPGPDFINMAVEMITPLSYKDFINCAVATIENTLGRVRTEDKNSPRTIDIDIILFDNKILDQTVWSRVHTAITIGELLPGLLNPATGETLAATAARLVKEHPVKEAFEILEKIK